jgi:hypothetical protein
MGYVINLRHLEGCGCSSSDVLVLVCIITIELRYGAWVGVGNVFLPDGPDKDCLCLGSKFIPHIADVRDTTCRVFHRPDTSLILLALEVDD